MYNEKKKGFKQKKRLLTRIIVVLMIGYLVYYFLSAETAYKNLYEQNKNQKIFLNEKQRELNEKENKILQLEEKIKKLMEVKERVKPGMEMFIEATAYSRESPGCSRGITRSESEAKIRKTIAVDPTVIPLGTNVYIEFPDAPQYTGYYKAEDTGGVIIGNIIDLFVLDNEEAINFGRRKGLLTIVE